MAGCVQEDVSDNFYELEYGFDDDSCLRNFNVEKELNHGCSSVSSDGIHIEENNYIHESKDEFEGCPSDGTSSSQYTNEFSPSGFFVGQVLKKRRFEEVWSESTSNEYTNEFSPSGFLVGRKIRAKKADDGDANSESSVGCFGHDNDNSCDGASDLKDLESNSDDYTNEFSPSGFFVGKKIRATKYDSDAKSESSIGCNGNDQDGCEVQSKSTSSEYSSRFFIGRKTRANVYYSDEESESCVRVSCNDRDACEVQSRTTTDSYEYSPLGFGDSRSTSNEYSPSGFFVGKKIKAGKYDDDTKSEDSVGFYDDRDVAVTEEEFQEIDDHTVSAGKKNLVTKQKRKALDGTDKEKLVSKRKRTAAATVTEVEERGEVKVEVEQRQIVVSALMAPRICPWRNNKGQLKKRCIFKQ